MRRLAPFSLVLLAAAMQAPTAFAQNACPAGSAGPGGVEPCTPCAAGYYSPVPGAGICTPCPLGRYANFEGAAQCLDCEPGTFSNVNGAATCTLCAPGRYAEFAGAIACLACPPGYAAAQPGSTSCLLCGAGTFASVPESTTCMPCGAGSYSEVLGATGCSACPAGTASNLIGAASASACIPCPAGTRSVFSGSPFCATCPRNSYAPATGSTDCLVCGCDDAIPCTRDTCDVVTAACSAPVVPLCEEVEVPFDGTVSYVDPRLGSPVTVGEPLTGRFRYDPEAPDSAGVFGLVGDYENAITSFEVAVGATAQITASSTSGRMSVESGWISGDVIRFEVEADDGLVATPIGAVPDAAATFFQLRLAEEGYGAVPSRALPTTAPDFSLFSSRYASLEIGSPTLGNLYVDSDDVTSAPEPQGVLTAAVAICVARALRRRRGV